MNLDDLWTDIEAEQLWREEEIRFLQNQVTRLANSRQQDVFRRSLVVMLYAHFEGFCKFAFYIYIRTVNELKITCDQANFALAAAALADLFASLRDPFKKCKEFRNSLPSDEKLHRFARDREFIERANAFGSRVVAIPETVVDMEDNLKPVVLRKALFRLGLPHDQFEAIEGQVNKLIEFRNGIAHGSFRQGVPEEKYIPLRDAVFTIMNSVKREIMAALQEQRFLKTG